MERELIAAQAALEATKQTVAKTPKEDAITLPEAD
jgi:hypothetical protein